MDPETQKTYNKDSKFKGWFLTYPKCDISKEQALVILQTNGLPKILEYVIAEESHSDGTPHLHAFVKLEKKIRFSQAKFDLLSHHGNYQPAKSWKAVQNYCKKDGNYISNIDVESASKKQSKKLHYTDFERDPLELLEEGILSPLSLNNFIKNRNTYLGLKRQKEESQISWENLIKNRHQWIFGPSNSGKTTAMRRWIKDMGEENCCEIPYNNDWSRYSGQKFLYADEFKGQLSVQELNRICDGGVWVNTKGSSTRLRKDVEVKIFSNFNIRDTYSKIDDKLLETLHNRFEEVDIIGEGLNI